MNYQNLKVWKKSMKLTTDIYDAIQFLPNYELYALSDQMRRAAVSIPSNIAEGAGRETDKEFKHFLYVARGSSCELETQCILCREFGYLDEEHVNFLLNQITLIKVLLSILIKRLAGSKK